MYEIWEKFDFKARAYGVKITIAGSMPIPGQIRVQLKAGAGSFVENDDALKVFWCVKTNDSESQPSRVGFDWKDMESIAAFSPSTNTITANVSEIFLIDPSTVGTTSMATAISDVCQRKAFYANGRYWVFFSDGTNMVYSTSTDGTTWTTGSQSPIRACSNGSQFSVFFDGTYVHYAWADDSANPMVYRRGTPNSDGSITWSTTSEQTAYLSDSTHHPAYPFVSVDSDGYPWIGFSLYWYGHRSYVTKSSMNNGTWSTPSGFPYELTNTISGYNRVTIVPLTNSKVYALYTGTGAYVYGKLWTGSWGSQEQASTGTIQSGSSYSAVASNDDVHLVYLTSSNIKYRKRVYGTGWQSEVTVQGSVTTTSAPTLSINTLTGNLYCFWAGSPTSNHIYYKSCVGGTWDTNPTDWINEATDSLTANNRLTCFYSSYGGKIALVYMTKTSSPYNVRFNCLNVLTSTVSSAIYQPFQRKSFYANGRFWIFYSDGTNMKFSSSTDGSAWDTPTTINTGITIDNGEKFSVWFDGNYVHYACCAESANTDIFYRRGTPNSDGTITWSDQQTAVAGISSPSTTYYTPCIAVDSSGYPWIGYKKDDGTKRPMVTKSTKTDGTWTTDTTNGFPKDLTGWDLTYGFVVPVPLTGGKMACIYTSYNQRIRLKSWSGSAWNNEWKTASTDTISNYFGISAVAQGDTVYMVFLTGAYRIRYTSYTYDSNWSSSVLVQDSVTSSSSPVLSINNVNNDLYCFWAGSPTSNHIYYKRCVGGTWDSSPTDWITETTDGLTANDLLTCFYSSYGYKIGLVYMTKTSSPYNIRFNYLSMPVVPEYPYGLIIALLICFPIYIIARHSRIDKLARTVHTSPKDL